MYAFLVICGVVIGLCFLIAYFVLANEFSKIAQSKGYSKGLALFFCIFLGIGGYLFVIALPDIFSKKSQFAQYDKTSDVLPEI